jgi:hypothetical protein
MDKFQKRFAVVAVVVVEVAIDTMVVVDKFRLESLLFSQLFYNLMMVDSTLLFENILLV